jgi:putative two-component system response regulator
LDTLSATLPDRALTIDRPWSDLALGSAYVSGNQREEVFVQDLKRDARILVVDDEPANVRMLELLLSRVGYEQLFWTTDPRKVLEMHEAISPDLVLLDLHMPHVDGFELLGLLSARNLPGEYRPILVLTADATEKARERALSTGAHDFLTKPLQRTEVLLRIHNLLSTRFLHRRLQRHNEELDEKVRERTRELEEAQLEILARLTLAAEFRDDETGQHTRRVGENAARIAAQLALPESEVELIRGAAPLHDVGKIAIPDAILLKPGPLSIEERTVMRSHTEIGARMLAGGRSDLLRLAEKVALSHHERWDGKGYPRGLRGPEIPLAARIVAIADFFDALMHDRPYREAWSPDRVFEEIRRETGAHFDPRVVDAFMAVTDRMEVGE